MVMQKNMVETHKTIDATTGVFKTTLCKKIAKIKLKDETRWSKKWITDFELLMRYMRKLNLKVDDR